MQYADPILFLGIIAAFCFLIACSFAYNNTFGALLQQLVKLGSVSIGIPHVASIHPLKPIADAAEVIDNAIRNAIGNGIAGTEWAWHKLIHANAAAFEAIGRIVADVAESVEQTFSDAYHRKIPAMIAVALGPLGLLAYGLKGQIGALQKAGTTTVTHVTHITRTVVREIHTTVTKAISVPLPRIGALERDVTGLEKWVRANRAKLTAAGLAGLVVAALGRLGLGWVRCSRVSRAGKQVCGMDAGLLDSLLADTLIIAGTVSLVEFARGMQTIVADIEEPIRRFWRAA